ncbi:hypothetical protein C0995_007394 [Termitomyces sp. Mi166|nr:hypothetical protein C0995_007394 [Termitomyces sp. Mi166\
MSDAQKSNSRLAKTLHNFIDRLTPGSHAPSPVHSQGSNVHDAESQRTKAIATASNASLVSATANPSREERTNKIWIRFQVPDVTQEPVDRDDLAPGPNSMISIETSQMTPTDYEQGK